MSSPLHKITVDGLQAFVTQEIEPDTAYIERCNQVVQRLCEFMKNSFPEELRPSEIIKSGSLGKGTALKGKSDADLVVFLSNYDSISFLKQKLPNILKQIKTYMGTFPHCTVTGETIHAVHLSLSCHDNHAHDVDILPSVNILTKESKGQIYAEMKSESRRDQGLYSAPLSPLQIEFVSRVPAKVKTLIRLVKYWKKTDLEKVDGRPPASYLLELITIGKWEEAKGESNFELRKGLFHVISALAQYRSLKFAWNTNYKETDFSPSWSVPYVLDPANPFNNVMSSCNCWEEIAKRANDFLNKPIFHGLSASTGW